MAGLMGGKQDLFHYYSKKVKFDEKVLENRVSEINSGIRLALKD